MRLSIKIRITWLNNNLLGYLPKYKFSLAFSSRAIRPPALHSSSEKVYEILTEKPTKKDRLKTVIECCCYDIWYVSVP